MDGQTDGRRNTDLFIIEIIILIIARTRYFTICDFIKFYYGINDTLFIRKYN